MGKLFDDLCTILLPVHPWSFHHTDQAWACANALAQVFALVPCRCRDMRWMFSSFVLAIWLRQARMILVAALAPSRQQSSMELMQILEACGGVSWFGSLLTFVAKQWTSCAKYHDWKFCLFL